MKKIKILGISGKRFSGKDTFASLLVAKAKAQRDIDLQTYAFAAESKRLFAAIEKDVDLVRLSSDRDYKEQWRPKLTEFTVRSINADPLVFCRSVADRIEQGGKPALITDVRLRLEVEHLRSRFHLHLVRLTRRDEGRRASGWVYSDSADTHHTETELDDGSLWDEIVPNDATIDEDLAQRAEALINRWAT
jgi:phosphomevalonate kinase